MGASLILQVFGHKIKYWIGQTKMVTGGWCQMKHEIFDKYLTWDQQEFLYLFFGAIRCRFDRYIWHELFKTTDRICSVGQPVFAS